MSRASGLNGMNGTIGMKLDHIGVAVGDLKTAGAAWSKVTRAAGPPEDVGGQGVRVQFCDFEGGAIELLAAAGDDTPVGRFLARRGEGLHHIAFRVPDIRAALGDLEAQGARLIDREPRPGAHGTEVAFVHPSAFAGVLVELVQHPEGA